MSFHPVIAGVARAVSPYRHSQSELTEGLVRVWSKHASVKRERVETLHTAVRVKHRHLSIPMEEYFPLLDSFEGRNKVWTRVAVELGEQAIAAALERAGLTPRDVDAIFFTTVTGLATPSVDARLINRMGLRPNVMRTPMFGLGCVAGVAGTARAAHYLRANPQHTAVLLAVELCSLTVQAKDLTVANMIAAGLFGDGAAAVVLRGSDVSSTGPRVVASEAVFYPDTEEVMGWEFLDSGFKVILSGSVPEMVTQHVRSNVDTFLAKHGLSRSDVTHWIAHTGGPKVLEAFEASLELPPNALARSWRSLEEVGNLSSASVLFVLDDLLRTETPKPGTLGLMIAMGPGFCSELVLLRW